MRRALVQQQTHHSAGPSFLKRLWKALKPPPAVRQWRPTPRQKWMLILAVCVLTVIVVGGGAWAYITSAQQRAQAEFEQGTRLLTPGSYGPAVQHFNRALAIWPRNPEVYYQRGIAHHLLGQSDAAIADFNSALDQDPQFAAAYTELGAIQLERGDSGGALQNFNRALEIEPSANGYYQRGQTYAALGQLQPALDDFDRSIAEFREAPYVYRARAEVRRRMGDVAGSRADHEISRQREFGDSPRPWVDVPLPPDTPEDAVEPQPESPKPPAKGKALPGARKQ